MVAAKYCFSNQHALILLHFSSAIFFCYFAMVMNFYRWAQEREREQKKCFGLASSAMHFGFCFVWLAWCGSAWWENEAREKKFSLMGCRLENFRPSKLSQYEKVHIICVLSYTVFGLKARAVAIFTYKNIWNNITYIIVDMLNDADGYVSHLQMDVSMCVYMCVYIYVIMLYKFT